MRYEGSDASLGDSFKKIRKILKIGQIDLDRRFPHPDRVGGHLLAGNIPTDPGAHVENPLMPRTCDGICLYHSLAERPAAVGAMVIQGEKSFIGVKQGDLFPRHLAKKAGTLRHLFRLA